MSEPTDIGSVQRVRGIECVDPEGIVIALPRHRSLTVSGGVRTVPADRNDTAAPDVDEETEPVLAD